MKKNSIFLIVISSTLLLFFIVRAILNLNNYDFLGWMYHFVFIIINITLIIESLYFINGGRLGKKNVIESFFLILLELPFCIVGSAIIAIFLNIHVESVIVFGKEKFIKSYDAFEIHPSAEYYEYINPFVRKKEKLEYNLELDQNNF